MSDPNNRQAGTERRDPAVTGVMKSAPPDLEGIPYEYDLPVEPTAPAYVREPLFNKKVMVVWAALALGVWFAIKIIIPVAFDSAKTSIVEAVKQAQLEGRNGSAPGTIRIVRNGHVITIVTDPRLLRPVAAPAPVIPPEPAPSR